jgi:hypothetical protein
MSPAARKARDAAKSYVRQFDLARALKNPVPVPPSSPYNGWELSKEWQEAFDAYCLANGVTLGSGSYEHC